MTHVTPGCLVVAHYDYAGNSQIGHLAVRRGNVIHLMYREHAGTEEWWYGVRCRAASSDGSDLRDALRDPPIVGWFPAQICKPVTCTEPCPEPQCEMDVAEILPVTFFDALD